MKCVLYFRYSPRPSVNRDAAGDAESLNGQRRICRGYAAVRGWEIVGEFCDEEKSGKAMKHRPGLLDAIAAAKKHKAVLIVAKLDRLARNVPDTYSMCQELKAAGSSMLSATEPFDTSTAIGEAMMGILAIFANMERRNTAERTSYAMTSMQQAGRCVGGKPPYGWKRGASFSVKQPNGSDAIRYMLAEDADEQRVLKKIRELAAGGLGPHHIAVRLNEEGEATRTGGDWHATGVLRITDRDLASPGKVFNPKNQEAESCLK
jgi:site-specific DNA recombinase